MAIIQEEEIRKLIEERDELQRENERLRAQLSGGRQDDTELGEIVPEDFVPKLWS